MVISVFSLKISPTSSQSFKDENCKVAITKLAHLGYLFSWRNEIVPEILLLLQRSTKRMGWFVQYWDKSCYIHNIEDYNPFLNLDLIGISILNLKFLCGKLCHLSLVFLLPFMPLGPSSFSIRCLSNLFIENWYDKPQSLIFLWMDKIGYL